MKKTIEQITESSFLTSGRLFVVPMPTKDLISFAGSLRGGEGALSTEKDLVPHLFIDLLDAGTTHKSKQVIRELLSNRGASLSYSVGINWISFEGSCLPEDLPMVLSLAAECIRDALFPTTELTKVRERRLSRLMNSANDTAKQASGALSRLLFETSHPNYVFEDSVYKKRYQQVSRKDLINFKKILGSEGMILALAGDITKERAVSIATAAFKSLPKGNAPKPQTHKNMKSPLVKEVLISIPDKANIDVCLGVRVPLYYGDRLYYPALLLIDMLGGGFTSYLAQTVRERDGLTYDIRAGLHNVGQYIDGYLEISALFSPEVYERGVQTIRTEVQNFLKNGITREALAKKKTEFIGAYPLSFSTTSGMVNKLATIAKRDEPLSHLRAYIDAINSITLEQVQEAVALIPFNLLSLAAAGTFAKKSS
jgi:zinc protease